MFTVKTDYTFDNAPHMDLLVVPGGIGVRKELDNERFMRFFKQRATDATTILTYDWTNHNQAFLLCCRNTEQITGPKLVYEHLMSSVGPS